MELERPDGFRLRIRPNGDADMLALMVLLRTLNC
jgi:hypothetical protein